MDIQKKEQQNQQVATSQRPTLPERLQNTIIQLGAEQDPAKRQGHKLGLVSIAMELMPKGKPDYLGVVNYPKISELVMYCGEPQMLLVISIMVRDFCAGLNVQRNMNEDQILEAAAMLLNECDNFRLEDYLIMFTLAKQGKLAKIYERIDLEKIVEILDAYWLVRKRAADDAQEQEVTMLEGLGPVGRFEDQSHGHALDVSLLRAADGLAGAMNDLKNQVKEVVNGKTRNVDGGPVQSPPQ